LILQIWNDVTQHEFFGNQASRAAKALNLLGRGWADFEKMSGKCGTWEDGAWVMGFREAAERTHECRHAEKFDRIWRLEIMRVLVFSAGLKLTASVPFSLFWLHFSSPLIRFTFIYYSPTKTYGDTQQKPRCHDRKRNRTEIE